MEIAKKVDLGCGRTKKPGFLGVDVLDFPEIDIQHNLNIFPYPFADNEVEEVWMDQVLEHLSEPMSAINEIFRICKPGAVVTISVPYFRSFYSIIDPTHRNFFGIYWFDYFDPEKELCKRYGYSNSRFKLRRLQFDREFQGTAGFIQRQVIKLAEARPIFYESKLSHLYPLNSLTFHLTVLK